MKHPQRRRSTASSSSSTNRSPTPTPPPSSPSPYHGVERRACPRFEPVDERAWIVWLFRHDYQIITVRLLDISRQGALVDCKEPPPFDNRQPLWFALPASCVSGDIPARVVARTSDPTGRTRLRIHFEIDCPDDLFFSAVDGLRAWLALGSVN